jgi:sodium-independent sulfate anion transporter 11
LNRTVPIQISSIFFYHFEHINMNYLEKAKADVRNDATWNRAARLSVKGAKALPAGTVQYISDKVPIVGWLPKYNPRWIVNDLIAGLTLGLMLIPQGLSYAKIANIPVEYGLMSSWLPAAIYAFMGSTKGELTRVIVFFILS